MDSVRSLLLLLWTKLPNTTKTGEHTFECSQSVHKSLKKSCFPLKKIPHVLAFSDYKTYNKTTVGKGGAKYHGFPLNGAGGRSCEG